MVTWTILPRGKDLRRSFNPIARWDELVVVERHNVSSSSGMAPGTWKVKGDLTALGDLLAPGRGVMIFRDDVMIMSGPWTSVQPSGDGTLEVAGFSDAEVLNDRILFPDPTRPITSQPIDYDDRKGPAETVMLGYIAANLGPAARTERRLSTLRVPASQGRGGTVSIRGRLDMLGNTVSDVAESGGLHYDVLQGEDTVPYLGVTVRPVHDRTANVRFGATNDFAGGLVGSDWSYTLERPSVTDAIVAGGGQGAQRIFRQATDPTAEGLWGAKVEKLVDQRQTEDVDDLDKAAADELADGANPVQVSFTISDSTDISYRRDWQVGDRVGVFIAGLDLTNPVREVTTTVKRQSNAETETIEAVVGSRDSSNWVTRTNTDVAKALQQLRALRSI